MRIRTYLFVGLIALLSLGNRGCQTVDTVVVPEGPKAAALGVTKDTQIAELTKQVADTKASSDAKQAEAAKAASNLKGVLKASEYMPASLPKDAVKAEAELGLTRLPEDDPKETVEALERVVLIVTGQRDEALKRYAEADAETKKAQDTIKARDNEIAKRDDVIKARETEIAHLTTEKETEAKQHATDFKNALDKKDAEIKKVKEDAASRERATWVLWARIASLGLVVIGVVVAVVFKIVPEGAGLAGAGVVIGLITMFVDWLVAQVWWPYLCGTGLLAILIVGGFALYRAWRRHELLGKVTAALQDLKDESVTLGGKLHDQVDEHLNYRLGDKGKAELTKLSASLGLINPHAESATSSDKPV